jgi:hypothetical protein
VFPPFTAAIVRPIIGAIPPKPALFERHIHERTRR